MITIKLPYKTNTDMLPIMKQYSSVLRFAYNRFLDDKSEKEIRHIIKQKFNFTTDLNSWIIQCAIKDAKSVHQRFKEKKVVFGGHRNLLFEQKIKYQKLNLIKSV